MHQTEVMLSAIPQQREQEKDVREESRCKLRPMYRIVVVRELLDNITVFKVIYSGVIRK